MKANIKTRIPGPKSTAILNSLKKHNGGYGGVYPYVHSHQGIGSEGKDIDGKRFKLSDYRGKIVVLDFWGNW